MKELTITQKSLLESLKKVNESSIILSVNVGLGKAEQVVRVKKTYNENK